MEGQEDSFGEHRTVNVADSASSSTSIRCVTEEFSVTVRERRRHLVSQWGRSERDSQM